MSDISLFGLGKPAKVLVEKVANAFGRHFDSSQTVRMAEAEARAYHILEINKAETDLEVADLRRRAAARLINEEMTNRTSRTSRKKQLIILTTTQLQKSLKMIGSGIALTKVRWCLMTVCKIGGLASSLEKLTIPAVSPGERST